MTFATIPTLAACDSIANKYLPDDRTQLDRRAKSFEQLELNPPALDRIYPGEIPPIRDYQGMRRYSVRAAALVESSPPLRRDAYCVPPTCIPHNCRHRRNFP